MKAFLFLVVALLAGEGINGLLLPANEYGRLKNSNIFSHSFARARRIPRPSHRVIDPSEDVESLCVTTYVLYNSRNTNLFGRSTSYNYDRTSLTDCFLVTSEEGELFFKSPTDEPTVCGIYMIADPDKRIQVTFNYIDVPCENGGLVAWVDGWELNGQVWPADAWDDDRVVESCDRRPQRKLISRQNAALIQYRVPAQGKGFAVTIRHLKNSRPCNLMLFGSEGIYTLRNHGETGNCSIIAVSPAIVRVLDLNVGQPMKRDVVDMETGTIHRCTKRGMLDFVDIGGASGLDHTNMEVLDSVCGLDSNEGRRPAYIACEDTVVRLVSSGRYHNSVTLAFAPLPMEDIGHSDLICGLNAV